jgi:hypothetical protein
MATNYDATIYNDQSTDANFRSWVNFIHNTFLLSGAWLDAGDSGQMNVSTVTRPTAANTSQGYRVYKMNDGLQSTAPVFVKIEFGSSGNANYPNIWVTIGTGTNGAGTLSGVIFARTAITTGSVNGTIGTCYGSASNNRLTLAMWTTISNQTWWLSIERSKDNTGADTNAGLYFAWGTGAINHSSQYLPFSGAIPIAETGLQFILSTNNPTVFGTSVGAGLMIPMAGVGLAPGYNIAIVNSSDFANYSQFTLNVWSVNHVYQHMGPNIYALRATRTDSNTRLCLLFE